MIFVTFWARTSAGFAVVGVGMDKYVCAAVIEEREGKKAMHVGPYHSWIIREYGIENAINRGFLDANGGFVGHRYAKMHDVRNLSCGMVPERDVDLELGQRLCDDWNDKSGRKLGSIVIEKTKSRFAEMYEWVNSSAVKD